MLTTSSLFADSGYSRTIRFNLNLNNITLEKVFEEIEKRSEFSILYKSKDINLNEKVSISVQHETIEDILSKVLKNQGLQYEIKEKHILIYKQGTANQIGQQTIRTITGSIIDKAGETVIGAKIYEKGTTNSVISDIDGKFSINIPVGGVLVISYIGFVTQEIKIANQSVLNITLNEDTKLLDEVVVVGYGTQKKANLTGAVESISVKNVKSRAYTNAEIMLQGNIAGAFISQNSGQPGNDGAKILIRGIGTFNNTDPLIIIDGMQGTLNDINPKDIETISVLKDAASCAIYGNRAANGVVLITTKSGEFNRMEIEYNGLYGIQKATSLPKVLTGLDFLELSAEAYYNTNKNYPAWYNEKYMNNYRNHVDEYMFPTNYNWIDDVFRVAQMTDHHVSISGGGKYLKHSTSAGFLYQDGIVKGNESQKFTFRSNVMAKFLNDKLKISASISTQHKTVEDLVDGMSSAIYSAYVAPPTIRMSIPGLGYNNHGYSFGARAEGGFNRNTSMPLTLNGTISLDLIKGLNISAYGGYNRESSKHKIFRPTVSLYNLNDDGSVTIPQPRTSELSLGNTNTSSYTFSTHANYSRQLGAKHHINVMGGYEMREYSYNYEWMYRSNLTVNLPEFGVGDPSTQKNSSNASELSWMSVFGRFNYTFMDRYLFEINLRNDGASRFIDKWGLFPSASIGWRITEEKFMKPVKWLNNLKLRFSWGKLGNESIGQSYAASDELSLSEIMNFNNSLVSAAGITKLANKKTTWESSEQFNFGLDFDLFNNRLSGSVDYYIKNTSDILMQVPVSSTLGMTTIPYQNAGKMENRGLEIILRYNDKFGDVNFSSTISGSHVTNKVKNLGGKDEIIMGNMIWRVGKPFNSFYGLQTEGIYQSDEEINNHLIFNRNGTSTNPYMGMTPYPGDIRFKDQVNMDADGDGILDARDGVIDVNDKVIIGQTFPDWTFSGSFSAEWRGIDLTVFLQGVYGLKSLNQGIITVPFHGGNSNTGVWYKDRWTAENPSKKIQRLNSDPGRSEIISEYYLEDASYLRVKNLDIGYTLPKSWTTKLGSPNNQIRVYVSLQNLFTFTKMRYGFDPEKPTNVSNTLQYPQTRIYSLGVNIKF